jgi:lysophospholipase L1-like esterase
VSGPGAIPWVGTWTASPQLTSADNLPPAPLAGSVLRQVVHVSLGGSGIRVRFSNEFGDGALTLEAARVAVCKADPVDDTVDVSTDRALAFSGAASVTIAAGQAAWSDPLDFALAPLGNLAVTVAFGRVPDDVTGHPGSRTTSYQQAGSRELGAASMASALATDHWYVVSGVDVRADPAARAIVVLGDSLTDGRGSTTNGNDRWPDLLARRLRGGAATANVAVLNQGIGGNHVVRGGLGPAASARYRRDVLGQSGARWLIVFEGVNDIGAGTPAPAITAAFDEMIAAAHAAGLRVYGATLAPFHGHSHFTAANEAARQAVNAHVRGGAFDAFIDFDAALRDGASPPRLQPAYDGGDGLHLTPAGYRKLADSVDLSLFTR